MHLGVAAFDRRSPFLKTPADRQGRSSLLDGRRSNRCRSSPKRRLILEALHLHFLKAERDESSSYVSSSWPGFVCSAEALLYVH